MIEDDNLVGQQIGNYRLQGVIARGTYGSVYLGQHWLFRDELAVAIKLLNTRLGNKRQREQFTREASLLRRLKHRSILPLIDAGVHDGIPYLVTLYAAGGSLRDLLDRQQGQPMPLEGALWVLLQLGEALEHAHGQHVVHRDLKPENILFGARGEVFLADFGLAVVLESSQTNFVGSQGTPLYMAPEQFEGYISPKSDQYAFACVAYEMMAGRRPFSPQNPGWETIWYHHTRVTPPPPTQFNPLIPPQIEQALLRGLAKDRAARYHSIAELMEALIPPLNLLSNLSPISRLSARSTTPQPALLPSGPDTSVQPALQPPSPNTPAPETSAQPALRPPTAQRHAPDTSAQPEVRAHAPDTPHQREENAPEPEVPDIATLTTIRQDVQDSSKQPAINPHAPATSIRPMLKWRAQHISAQPTLNTPEPPAKRQTAIHSEELRREQTTPEELAMAVNALELLELTSDDYRKQGHAFRDAGVYDRALASYEQAIQLDPNNPLAYYGKAKVYWDQQRYTEALQAYDAIVHLQPKDPFFQALRGNALYEIQNYPAALAAYDEALNLKQDNAAWYARRASILYELQRYVEALHAYDLALALKPEEAYYYICKGDILNELKHEEEALQMYAKAVEVDPRESWLRHNKSYIRHDES